ncbi:MAG TPA: hypothetical protein VFS10_07945 [Pyrinomonadaceae bacterium]|nr:hypothetical protein [Pyrinomonadaceae bacterium]
MVLSRPVAVRLIIMLAAALYAATPHAVAQKAGRTPYASERPLPTARIFGAGVISTEDFDDYFTFTPDGRTIYFTKHNHGFGSGTIVVSHFKGGGWSAPEVVAFSGRFNDSTPCLSPDGTKLFFTSDRPVEGTRPRNNSDIWVVERTPSGWSEPRRLPAPVNTDNFDWHPGVAADGTLYFASNRTAAVAGNNIYRARPVAGGGYEVEILGDAVNGPRQDMHPTITPDGRTLLFVSEGRADSLGNDDLYVSYLRDGAWTTARNLGPAVNTKFYEYSARLSPDGKYLFFCRGFGDLVRPPKRLDYGGLLRLLRSPFNGLSNIYQIDARAGGVEEVGGAR